MSLKQPRNKKGSKLDQEKERQKQSIQNQYKVGVYVGIHGSKKTNSSGEEIVLFWIGQVIEAPTTIEEDDEHDFLYEIKVKYMESKTGIEYWFSGEIGTVYENQIYGPVRVTRKNRKFYFNVDDPINIEIVNKWKLQKCKDDTFKWAIATHTGPTIAPVTQHAQHAQTSASTTSTSSVLPVTPPPPPQQQPLVPEPSTLQHEEDPGETQLESQPNEGQKAQKKTQKKTQKKIQKMTQKRTQQKFQKMI